MKEPSDEPPGFDFDAPASETASQPEELPDATPLADESQQAQDSGKPSWYQMARSSEPDVRPADVRGKLDVGASWHEHLTVAFVKATNSGGVEAWMHAVLAMFLSVRAQNSSSEQADVEEDETSNDTSNKPRTFDGPQ
jgi:hypothetical protein